MKKNRKQEEKGKQRQQEKEQQDKNCKSLVWLWEEI